MKRVAFCLVLLACCGNAHAQPQAGAVSTAPTTPATPVPGEIAAVASAPYLWKVTVGPVTHYVLGSVHLLPKSTQPLPAALDQAYARADTLVFESNLGALDAPAMQRDVLAAARGDGLRDEIPATMYARVQARARSYGLSDSICDPYAAWFCAMTLEIFSFQQQGFDATAGLDQYFYAQALNDNKNVAWLEAPREHMQLFTEMTAEMGRHFLASTLEEGDDPQQQPAALLKAWKAGDTAYLERLVLDMKQRYPALYERLLAARNRAWLPVLTERLKLPAPQMIIVGAAHLVGADGLIPALRMRGFDVRRADAPSRAGVTLKLDTELTLRPAVSTPNPSSPPVPPPVPAPAR